MMDLSLSEEQQMLVDALRQFTREEVIPVAPELDRDSTFPEEVCRKAWNLGFMNSKVPEQFGGLGFRQHVVVDLH